MNIIITGAGKGLGYETLMHLACAGSHQILAISRNTHSIGQNLNGVVPFSFDLSLADYSPIHGWLQENMPRVDILINNAGQLQAKTFAESTDSDYRSMLEINFIAPVKMIKAVYPFLNRQGSHIVNIGSMGGVQGSSKFKGLSAYSASKAALMNLSECLAEELQEEAIRVNALALGSAQTQMLELAFPGYKASVQATEMASFIADFALSGNRFFNGKILPVAISTP